MSVILETKLPIPVSYRGKVRDTYDLGDKLLLIASDRISAFDSVLPCGIPDKGYVLNQLSAFWFVKTNHIISNHLIKVIKNKNDFNDIPSEKLLPDYLIGRSMLVHKAKRIPIEAVVRGYLSGSAWEEYRNQGTIAGVRMAHRLIEGQKLPEPLFTPTTKADSGHDLPLSQHEMEDLLGQETANRLEEKSIEVYLYARDYALGKGIIIADTKFEFGYFDNNLILIDELLTPDSSRLWDRQNYIAGRSQPSFDKQPVRDWLVQFGWNKEPPAPTLPDMIIKQVSTRYKSVYKMLVGESIKH